MSIKYLDKTRLEYFWSKIKSAFVEKEAGKGLSTNDYTTAEKTKLAGIEAGANAYTLPAATASALGGVKVGENISVSSDGTISIPRATKVQTGVVRFGNGFDFDANGRVILDEDEMPSDLYVAAGNFSGVSGSTVLFNRSANDCISAFKSGKLVLAKLNGVTTIEDEGQMPYSVLLTAVEYEDSTDIEDAGYERLTFRGFDGNGNILTMDYYSDWSQADVYIETKADDSMYIVDVTVDFNMHNPTVEDAQTLKEIANHSMSALKLKYSDALWSIAYLSGAALHSYVFTLRLEKNVVEYAVNTSAGTISVSNEYEFVLEE